MSGVKKITRKGQVKILKKSAIVVVINSLLIYDYIGGWEDVNPDLEHIMFTGTVAKGGIPVDLHTLAVSVVSKKKKLN